MKNRVWIYLSDKELLPEQQRLITEQTRDFLQNWKAHEVPLKAEHQILHNHFLIIKADEAEFHASGCSIDKQLRFIKNLEDSHGIQFLNRLLVAYMDTHEKVHVIHASKFADLLATGMVNPETPVFNVGIGTEEELHTQFKIPLKESWVGKKLSLH